MPPKSVGIFGAGTLYVQKDDGSYEKFADVNDSWEDLVGPANVDMSWDDEVSIADPEEQEVVFDAEFGGEKVFEGSIEIKPPVIIDGEYKEME